MNDDIKNDVDVLTVMNSVELINRGYDAESVIGCLVYELGLDRKSFDMGSFLYGFGIVY